MGEKAVELHLTQHFPNSPDDELLSVQRLEVSEICIDCSLEKDKLTQLLIHKAVVPSDAERHKEEEACRTQTLHQHQTGAQSSLQPSPDPAALPVPSLSRRDSTPGVVEWVWQ